jgi:protein TonB
MSESVSPAATAYQLNSDLAKLCLPAASRDPLRRLAYVNSICAAFLLVGLVGLKMPEPHVRAIPEPVEIVPVVFTPPDQPPPTPQEDTMEQPPEEDLSQPTLDTPVVATVVAADPANVAFAVPVQGPVILAPARFAAPPPRVQRPPPPAPTRFVPTGKEVGSFPWPRSYPRQALLERQQGTVTLLVQVGTDGQPTSVTIHESSGYGTLDRHALEWVRDHWRWPPGPPRAYYVPFVYQLPK